jgi:hypothetical protein
MTHPIPDEALDSDIAIIARKGSGKSYLARGLTERLLDLRRRMVVIDPLGAWWGLRAAADGQSEGYPVAVFGGEHGDMPLSATMGEPLAKLIASDNLPCVIDTSLMRKEEQGRLAIDLFEALFRLNKDALTIILEEADVFAPQNPAKDGYAAQVLHEVDRIARRGRARGLRLISLTQRPARLHKDVLSQAATLVAMRLSAPQDREAIKAWVEGNADRDQSREVIDSLASLAVGEGWVWAADLGILHRAKFPRIKTLDTSATPKAGETRIEPKTLAEVDVSAIREALQVPTGEAEGPSGGPKAPSKVQVAEAEDRGYQRGLAEGIERGKSQGIALGITRARAALDALRVPDIAAEAVAASPMAAPAPARNAPAEPRKPAQRQAAAPRAVSSNDPLLVAALSIWPARLTWAALASMCGRKARGGHFNTARKALIEGGHVRMDGELVTPTDPPAAPAGAIPADLLEQNLPQPAAKMFATIRAKPGITTIGLASVLQMQPRGGHWNTGMSTLRRSGLIIENEDGLHIPETLLGAQP